MYASHDGVLYRSYDDLVAHQKMRQQQMRSLDPYASYSRLPSMDFRDPRKQIHDDKEMGAMKSFDKSLISPFDKVHRPLRKSPRAASFSADDLQNATLRAATVGPMTSRPHLEKIGMSSMQPSIPGVGIIFAEKLDPQSGGTLVYVKRLIPGGAAEKADSNPPGHRVSPGDTLLLVDGEDVYGLGLDTLRDRIPGPAGSLVVLGFRSIYGKLFEVELIRSYVRLGGSSRPVGALPLDIKKEYDSYSKRDTFLSDLYVKRPVPGLDVGRPDWAIRQPLPTFGYPAMQPMTPLGHLGADSRGGLAGAWTQAGPHVGMMGPHFLSVGNAPYALPYAQNHVPVDFNRPSMMPYAMQGMPYMHHLSTGLSSGTLYGAHPQHAMLQASGTPLQNIPTQAIPVRPFGHPGLYPGISASQPQQALYYR